MKILAIRGKNLASLESEFDIDFTREPLKSSGIFAITGNTGAGKSTILDALCLALFDNAPRLKDAEQIDVADTEDKFITQRDSRNLLRRGAGEGYAEVDFIALDGDRYRSRWTVKRTGGKSEGALRQTAIILENLSTSTKEQGTKTELLKKISRIIGLTFAQFTRAVLLAQNDFFTFLKSKQSEKAELLEKLTGTEAYSKISAAIYRKTNDAKNELSLIQQRIADVELLSEEELEVFRHEEQNLKSGLKPLNELQTVIEKKLEWIEQETSLKNEIADAEKKLETALDKIRQAGNRYEYLRLIDVTQEIRDTFFSWKEKQNQSERLQEQIATGHRELESTLKQSEVAERELQEAKSKREENERQYASLKPEIEKAKELDIRIQSVEKNVKESRKELEIQEKNRNTVEKAIAGLQQEIAGIREENGELEIWFAGREAYAQIVTSIELMVTVLDDIQFTKGQASQLSENLKSNRELATSYQEQLQRREAEAERLNKLLPAEIVQLRAGLEEGKPCPVCGSVHHPLKESTPEIGIDEKELNRAKEETANAIASVREKIENTQKEITRLETLTANYRKQYEDARQKATGMFREIPRWEKELEKGGFQKRLTAFAEQWKASEQRLQQGLKAIEILQTRLESENNNLKQLQETCLRRKEAWQNQVSVLEELTGERKGLLEGKKAADVETRFRKLQEEYAQKVETREQVRNELENRKARINGALSQLNRDYGIYRQDAEKLYRAVNEWIDNPEHPVTLDMLAGLTSKTAEWITAEKNCLNGLNEKKVEFSTALKERQVRMKSHLESANRPDEGQNTELLGALLTDTIEKIKLAGKRLTEIEVSTSKHNDGLERVRAFEKELKKKEQFYQDWAKLNDLLGSAGGDKFKKIAQGYTLDVLLGYANQHLKELTGRYKLEKIPGTLSLQVVDNDMLGEVRTVHSLSGGESFLISLALALGLSSISSNRMKIESLFIDEGFGSLDIDTLAVAMNALENLQTQGRKIGVISHVEEMKERITTQIQVVKFANGKSRIEISGY
jgi:exonuclease SbcC